MAMATHAWSRDSVCLSTPAASVASARPAAVAEGTALEGDEQTVLNGGDVSDGVLLVDNALCGAGIEGYLSNVCALLRPKVSPYCLHCLPSLLAFTACLPVCVYCVCDLVCSTLRCLCRASATALVSPAQHSSRVSP